MRTFDFFLNEYNEYDVPKHIFRKMSLVFFQCRIFK